MALTNNLVAYTDVAHVLESAYAAGGALYRPAENPIHWRARAYKYRTLLRERDGRSDFDAMILQVEADTVRISFRELGALETLDGKPLAVIEKDDLLDREVSDFIRELEGKDD